MYIKKKSYWLQMLEQYCNIEALLKQVGTNPIDFALNEELKTRILRLEAGLFWLKHTRKYSNKLLLRKP